MDKKNKNIDSTSNIFNGSIALMGICLFVISILQGTNKRVVYAADDFFCLTLFLLFLSMLFTFIYIAYKEFTLLLSLAKVIFFIASLTFMTSGIVLVFEL